MQIRSQSSYGTISYLIIIFVILTWMTIIPKNVNSRGIRENYKKKEEKGQQLQQRSQEKQNQLYQNPLENYPYVKDSNGDNDYDDVKDYNVRGQRKKGRMIAQTPVMGWNSWNTFGCQGLSETVVVQMAHALVDTGLATLGYQYVNLDDCWQRHRKSHFPYNIQVDDEKFPSGMEWLVQYIHNISTSSSLVVHPTLRGNATTMTTASMTTTRKVNKEIEEKQSFMKIGLYSDAGIKTCQGRPGSLGYEKQDALQYHKWKIDYLKYDNCFNLGLPVRYRYQRMADALSNLTFVNTDNDDDKNGNRHSILFSLCEWGVQDPATWARSMGGQSWRTTTDIRPTWESWTSILDANDQWHTYAGPGGWNDPDMLEVGNGKLTLIESKAHFTLWCLIKAPLLLGNDVRTMSSDILMIVSNSEIIAWNQDSLGEQGYKRSSQKAILDTPNDRNDDNDNDNDDDDDDDDDDINSLLEVWAGNLSNQRVAVVLFNRSSKAHTITVDWETHLNISLSSSSSTTTTTTTTLAPVMIVRDVWSHKDLGMYQKEFTAMVESHGVVAVELRPIEEDSPYNTAHITSLELQ